MRSLVCLIVLCTQVLLGGSRVLSGQSPCCLPMRLQGQFRIAGNYAKFTFAEDHALGREMSFQEPFNGSFDIVDFGTEVIYNFRDGQCNATKFRGLQFFDRCFRDFDLLDTVMLSEAESGLDLKHYVFRKEVNNVIRIAYLFPRLDGTCIPVFIHDSFRGTSCSFYMSNPTDTISPANYQLLVSDVSNCQYIASEPTTTTKPTTLNPTTIPNPTTTLYPTTTQDLSQ